MKLAIITHVLHGHVNGRFFAYGPYVREMNIWIQHADSVVVVAPLELSATSAIDLEYQHHNIQFSRVKSFDVKSAAAIFKTLGQLPLIFTGVFRAMRSADHIHLRCPGNMGLVGCLIQMFFPSKNKTAKYAGNWDPNSKQPWSYKLQKWILNNRFLTRNMKVLVYGNWAGTSKNIVPFFTASYTESEKGNFEPRPLSGKIKFLFVGSLSPGKRPSYAIELVEKIAGTRDVVLDIYGDGPEYAGILEHIAGRGLENIIRLHGNQGKKVIAEAYRDAHFVILASKSEGWPKAVAEAMFWGCVPLVTNISCVNEMIGFGARGLLLELELKQDVRAVTALIEDELNYISKSEEACIWSQQYTIERFNAELIKIIEC